MRLIPGTMDDGPQSTTAGAPSSSIVGRRSSFLFWGLLAAVFIATIVVRMLSLREAVAGMGLDAYHHTLIAGMIVDHGGVPSNYEPFAPLSSFTYHFGFHTLIAAVAWLTGLTRPEDLLLLMPQVGQFATALPVLTLTLFGWRVLNNRWAGLLAGTLVGLFSIFPAYYVNWSRYTQGLGLALLPVAWVLFLNVIERPRSAIRSQTAEVQAGGADTGSHSALAQFAAIRPLYAGRNRGRRALLDALQDRHALCSHGSPVPGRASFGYAPPRQSRNLEHTPACAPRCPRGRVMPGRPQSLAGESAAELQKPPLRSRWARPCRLLRPLALERLFSCTLPCGRSIFWARLVCCSPSGSVCGPSRWSPLLGRSSAFGPTPICSAGLSPAFAYPIPATLTLQPGCRAYGSRSACCRATCWQRWPGLP